MQWSIDHGTRIVQDKYSQSILERTGNPIDVARAYSRLSTCLVRIKEQANSSPLNCLKSFRRFNYVHFLATGEEINVAAYFRREADNVPIAAEIIPELIKSRVSAVSSFSARSPEGRLAPKFAAYNVRKLFAFNSPHFVSARKLVPLITEARGKGGGREGNRTRKVPRNFEVAGARAKVHQLEINSPSVCFTSPSRSSTIKFFRD